MEFRFKQFIVKHEKSAMKVGTDGNLLGAWSNVDAKVKALDIGTGTGLLSLMIAQRNSKLQIDAIDIDEKAIEEAKENVQNSPFTDQISVFSSSFEALEATAKYDLIVSNPPFFFNQTNSKGISRSKARQGNQDWKSWIPKISSLLTTDGNFDCIFPIDQKKSVYKKAQDNGLFLQREWTIFPKKHLQPHRLLVSFGKLEVKTECKDFIIEKPERHTYTKEFEKLLKDYMIIFQ